MDTSNQEAGVVIPKKPKTAYFLFAEVTRPSIVAAAEGAKIGVAEIGKRIGQAWSALSPEEKKVYEDQAAAQREAWNLAKAQGLVGAESPTREGAEAEIDDGLILPLARVKRILKLDPLIGGGQPVLKKPLDDDAANPSPVDEAASSVDPPEPSPPVLTKPMTLNKDVMYLITAATQVFIGALAQEAAVYTVSRKRKQITEADVVSAINNVPSLDFLRFDFPLSMLESAMTLSSGSRRKRGGVAKTGAEGAEAQEEGGEEAEEGEDEEEGEEEGAEDGDDGDDVNEDDAEEGGEGEEGTSPKKAPKKVKSSSKAPIGAKGLHPSASSSSTSKSGGGIMGMFARAAAIQASRPPRPTPGEDEEVAVVGGDAPATTHAGPSSSGSSSGAASSSRARPPVGLGRFFSTLTPEQAKAQRETALKNMVVVVGSGAGGSGSGKGSGKAQPKRKRVEMETGEGGDDAVVIEDDSGDEEETEVRGGSGGFDDDDDGDLNAIRAAFGASKKGSKPSRRSSAGKRGGSGSKAPATKRRKVEVDEEDGLDEAEAAEELGRILEAQAEADE